MDAQIRPELLTNAEKLKNVSYVWVSEENFGDKRYASAKKQKRSPNQSEVKCQNESKTKTLKFC